MGVQVPPRTRMKRLVTDEAFYTPDQLAARCVSRVQSVVAFNDFDLIVEPSAGSGVFYDLLPVSKRVGIDISSSRPDILASDFLSWSPTRSTDRIMTLGNPPFGARASLAFRFISHAATFSNIIAFILPRSFKKDSFLNRFPAQFHLLTSFDDHESFRTHKGDTAVKTVFQIWEKRTYERKKIWRPHTHPDFHMRHAHLSRVSPNALRELRSNYAFTIPQVGSDFRPRDVRLVERGSHWFIQPRQPGVHEVFQNCDFSFLNEMNTVVTSVSRADIVQAYSSAKG
jgi:predicted RNA methylase